MTATAAPTVKDHELRTHGLVESASVSSFADFASSNLNEQEVNKEKEENDFINNFKMCVSRIIKMRIAHFMSTLTYGSRILSRP